MTYRAIFLDGYRDYPSLWGAQDFACCAIRDAARWQAAHGKLCTYYEPVEIVEIREDGPDGIVVQYGLPVGFDPVIQPQEPECKWEDEHDWKDNEDRCSHGVGFTWSRTCLNCGLIEYHDSWHDNGYGGTLYWIAYEFPVISELGMADKFGVIR